MNPPLVVIESPYAGRGWWPLSALRRWRNVAYVRACMRDSFLRGEYPIASHALYTQPGVLRDAHSLERQLGIEAGLAWAAHAERGVFYIDFGESCGMRQALHRHEKEGRPVDWRQLGGWWWRLLEGLG